MILKKLALVVSLFVGVGIAAFACKVRISEDSATASVKSKACDSVDGNWINEVTQSHAQQQVNGSMGLAEYKQWQFIKLTVQYCAGQIEEKEYCLEAASNRNTRITDLRERTKLGAGSRAALSADGLSLAHDILTFRSICSAN